MRRSTLISAGAADSRDFWLAGRDVCRPSHVAFPVAVFAIAFLLVILRAPSPQTVIADSDGAHQVAGARQVALGLHPFVHWRSIYGPLVFYVSHLVDVVSGGRPAGELVLCAFAYVLAYTLMFLCARYLSSTLPALVATLCAIATLPRFYKYYVLLMPALVLMAALTYLRRPSRSRLVLISGCVAIAGLFRADLGIYGAACAATAVGTEAFSTHSLRRAIRRGLALVALVIGFASPSDAFSKPATARTVRTCCRGSGRATCCSDTYSRLVAKNSRNWPTGRSARTRADAGVDASVELCSPVCHRPRLFWELRQQYGRGLRSTCSSLRHSTCGGTSATTISRRPPDSSTRCAPRRRRTPMSE